MQLQKYHSIIRILHWLMATIILGLIGMGWFMVDFGEQLGETRGLIYGIHKSFGVTIIILAIIRIFARFVFKAPELPHSIPSIQRKVARYAQTLMYALFIAVPIAGYAMSDSFGYGVKLFGIQLPKIFATDKPTGEFFNEVHGLIAYVFAGVIALHIVGAIKHRFFDKKENDILGTML